MNDDEQKEERRDDDGKGLLTEENPAGGLPQGDFDYDGRNPDTAAPDTDDENDDE